MGGAQSSGHQCCGWWPGRQARARHRLPAGGSLPPPAAAAAAKGAGAGGAGAGEEPALAASAAAEPGYAAEGREILDAVLEIEQRCLRCKEGQDEPPAGDQSSTECLVDEPEHRYFLCSDLSSPIVVGYLWLSLPDLRMEDVLRALTDVEERRARDADSEYCVHRGAHQGDPLVQEDISYCLRVPWPFCDRDVLQRRWQLPLVERRGDGLAVVMKSIEDDELLPPRSDRVRATTKKAAYLLRPMPGAERGLELVVCQQMDMGGLCPAWAQKIAIRFAVQRGLEWAGRLRSHCFRMEELRASTQEGGGAVAAQPSAPPPCHGSGSECPSSAACNPWRTSLSMRGPMSGQEVLDAIFAIERVCCSCGSAGLATDDDPASPTSQLDDATSKLSVDCLLDEPDTKYCLCGSTDSPIVIGYIRVALHDIYPGDVWRALVKTEERLARDPASEYQVLREAQFSDPSLEEDVAFVWRAPWPFWDRELLQRRWTFPLRGKDGGEGLAIVMRSFEDDALLPPREDRVRAFVHKCGYLLRPLGEGFHSLGVELTVCQQVDLGGLCPEWAQEVLTRWAVNRGTQWAEELREHCQRRHMLLEEEEDSGHDASDLGGATAAAAAGLATAAAGLATALGGGFGASEASSGVAAGAVDVGTAWSP